MLAGQRWEPQRDDKIDWIDDAGVKHSYNVLPRTDDLVFRYTDPSQQQLRVYTIEMAAAKA